MAKVAGKNNYPTEKCRARRGYISNSTAVYWYLLDSSIAPQLWEQRGKWTSDVMLWTRDAAIAACNVNDLFGMFIFFPVKEKKWRRKSASGCTRVCA